MCSSNICCLIHSFSTYTFKIHFYWGVLLFDTLAVKSDRHDLCSQSGDCLAGKKDNFRSHIQFSSVQSLSRVQLFATPWIALRVGKYCNREKVCQWVTSRTSRQTGQRITGRTWWGLNRDLNKVSNFVNYRKVDRQENTHTLSER